MVEKEPTVIIVGRPNVGKSTLYNRIVHRRDAIVNQTAGVTRDIQKTKTRWRERRFIIGDTGGYEISPTDDLIGKIQFQLDLAIKRADIIIFLVDAKEGLTPLDRQMASLLRKADKPIILSINKVDVPQHFGRVYDFYPLGFEDPIPISAEHNIGISELLERVEGLISPQQSENGIEPAIRIAIVGRPNAGKSSLVNKLLGEERVIVHQVPGTTRDAVDVILELKGSKYILTDTAGIRRKGKVKDKIDQVSMLIALKRIKRSDIAVLLLDAEEGITDQDARIAGYVHEAGRAIIIGVNKWDLIEDSDYNKVLFNQHMRERMAYLDYAPTFFLSAKTGQGIDSLFPLLRKVFKEYSKKIPTPQLNTFLQETVQRHSPPLYQQKPIKFYYITQIMTKPPSFLCFVNYPQGIHSTYQRYLQNQLREALGFLGTPIRLFFRARKKSQNDLVG
jgi:GTP-binding protein